MDGMYIMGGAFVARRNCGRGWGEVWRHRFLPATAATSLPATAATRTITSAYVAPCRASVPLADIDVCSALALLAALVILMDDDGTDGSCMARATTTLARTIRDSDGGSGTDIACPRIVLRSSDWDTASWGFDTLWWW